MHCLVSKKNNTQEFDCQPYPKINHNNMDLIKQYKDILNEKRNDYYQYLFLLLLFTVLPMLQVVNQLKLFIRVSLYLWKSSKKN